MTFGVNLQRIINKVPQVDVLQAFSVQWPRQGSSLCLLWIVSGRDKGKTLREIETFKGNFLVCVRACRGLVRKRGPGEGFSS